MKKFLVFLFAVATLASFFNEPVANARNKTALKQQQPFTFWFQNSGVQVYYKWTCAGCSDKHIVLKVVNENNYSVKVSLDKITWKVNGNQIKTEAGTRDYFKPGETKAGDYSGYWFYPPDGYADPRLSIDKILVEKDDGGL